MSAEPEWKAIDGFPFYEIDAYGRARTWRQKTATGKWHGFPKKGNRRESPKLMTPWYDKRGYARYAFRDDNGKHHSKTVHRLVAIAFLPNPHEFTDVAHNDGDPKNNHISNLRWCSHRDNQMDMRKHGTMQDGEKCVSCKLTRKQVLEIHRRAQKRGEGIKLSAEFGISRCQVSRIRNMKIWKHLW